MMAPAATNLTNHHPFGIAVRDKGSFFDLFHEPRPIWVEKGDNAHAVGSDSRCDDHLVRECKNRSAASGDRSIRQENPQYGSEEHTSELQSLMRISYAVF